MKTSPVFDRDSLRELRKGRESLRRIETFPYSEEVRSIMVSPVFTFHPDVKIKSVIREMANRGISSVVIVNRKDEPVGIVTERDILKRIATTDCLDIDKVPVSMVMTSDPIQLEPGDSIYRAISVLNEHRIKHLPISEGGRLAGIVTFRQLLKLRHPEPMMLISSIETAPDFEELRTIKDKQPVVAASKLSMGISAYEIVTMLSLINQDIHRKVLELVIDLIGVPPLGFCLFLTGSHGRQENLLTPDQDQGMIIEDSEQYYDDYQDYFIDLSKRFSEGLITAGFSFCPGYIMSMNPIWRKQLSEWEIQIKYWFETQISNLGRYSTVLYDAMPLYGNMDLFGRMKDFAFSVLNKHYEVLRVMHEEEGSHKIPIGFLGKFITEKGGPHKGELDVKRSGLIFVVEGIRILSLLHGIRETSTIKRINVLVDRGFLHKDDGEYFEAAYQLLLYHALRSEVAKATGGEKIDTYINPEKLSAYDKEMLRHAFKAVSALQELVASEFGELVL